MTPETKARQRVGSMLAESGWTVQTKDQLNLSASLGVALCELAVATNERDYTLSVDGKATGTAGAKSEGNSFTGPEEQSSEPPAWASPPSREHLPED